jgi:hypothetical protein
VNERDRLSALAETAFRGFVHAAEGAFLASTAFATREIQSSRARKAQRAVAIRISANESLELKITPIRCAIPAADNFDPSAVLQV